MAFCTYCDQWAGWLADEHTECRQKHDAQTRAAAKIVASLSTAMFSETPLGEYKREIEIISTEAVMNDSEEKRCLIDALRNCMEIALKDHLLSEREEAKLSDLQELFNLSSDVLGKDYNDRLTKAALLREVAEGATPQRVFIEGQLPIKLANKEQILFPFQHVDLLEPKTRTQYVGRSAGISVRVARGVYSRTGASAGERIQTTELARVDRGLFVITNQSIYFKGNFKGFRLRLDKVLSVQPHADAVEIFKEGTNARAQVFKVDDPWFAANLISLARGDDVSCLAAPPKRREEARPPSVGQALNHFAEALGIKLSAG